MADDLTPCVFCGTPRPREVPRCPTCNRGWIDRQVVTKAEPPSSDPRPETVTGPPSQAGADGSTDETEAVAAPSAHPEAGAAPAAPVDGEDDKADDGETAEAAIEGTEAPPPPVTATAAAGAIASSDPEAVAAPEGPADGEGDEAAHQTATAATEGADEPPPPVEATAAAAGASAGRTPSRPGDERPLNDRPGDRPPKDRPASERPVSPAPPAHPIDDASLHLDVTGEDPPPAQRRSRAGQRLLVAGVVAVLVAAWFGVLTWITRDDPAQVTATTTTPTVATSQAPVTGPSTTIGEPTTTAPEPTTTTVDPTLLTGPFPEVGNPVDISDLRLGAFAVSPIDFGDPDGLGRLVATLGQPGSANTVEDGGLGLCPGEPGFTATWGPFTALFTGTPEDGALVGYRLDNEPAAHPTAGLSTLSELSLGDTIEHLESVYPDFDISYEEIDGDLHFILVRSDGVTLLWGPVSSSEPDGTVLGIYSPEPCEGGPAASG
jgi:hypothetical protein